MELDFISFQGLDLEETPSPVQTARVEEDTVEFLTPTCGSLRSIHNSSSRRSYILF